MLLIKVTQSVPVVCVCTRGVRKQRFLPANFPPQLSMPCSRVQPSEPSVAYSSLHGLRDGVIVLSAYCFVQLWEALNYLGSRQN